MHLTRIFIFLFISTCFICSCTDLNDVEEPLVILPPPEALYFFEADVAGESLEIGISEEGDGITGLIYEHDSLQLEGVCRYDYKVTLRSSESPEQPTIELQNFYNGDCGSESLTFDQLFFSEEVPFFDMQNPISDKSVIVSIQYPNSRWSSDLGDNSSAEFRVTGGSSNNNENGKRVLVTGRFSCKLYKEGDPEESKNISDAEFRVNFAAYED